MGIRETLSALLFDFDGTIADTSQTWDRVTLACFCAQGFELDEEMLSLVLANPWPDVVPWLSKADAIAIEQDILDSIFDAYLDCAPAAGLDVLLRGFADVPKGIVTSSYRERLVVPYLRRHGLEQYFAVVVGSEDTERLKPDPEPVLLALKMLDADHSGAWMIGDSPADIQAARAAGIRSVGLGNRAVGGDHFADSVPALASLLTAIAAEDKYLSQ